ncbi:MAG: VTT domain-containing protein, partial [Kiloniellales bacterium]
EVERLYIESLRAARRFVYIENQFLTSSSIGAAIAASLKAAEGPELVLVLPSKGYGMLEGTSMGIVRGRVLKRLRKADRHGRLAVYCPTLGEQSDNGEGACDVKIHSKVMVIDDRFARVGSSNLANRSMGLDTECDLAIETEGAIEGEGAEGAGDSEDRGDVAAAILGLRDRLLAEHLGCRPEEVAAAVAAKGSLIGAVESLRGPGRSLIPVEDSLSELLDQIAPSTRLLDPKSPLQAERLAHRLFYPDIAEAAPPAAGELGGEPGGGSAELPRSALRKLWLFGLLLALLIGFVLAWTFTPLSQLASVESLERLAAAWQDEPLTPLLVVVAYLIGGLLAFPIVALISLTGALFGPVWGFAYGLAGSLLSATMLFWLGALLGRDAVQRLGGASVNRISQRLGKHGIVTVAVLSVLPLAPFSLVNLAIGASHIGFRDFVIGTLIGMVPGMYALVIFGDRLISAIVAPSPGTVALLVAALLVLAAVTYGSRLWLARRNRKRPGPDAER